MTSSEDLPFSLEVVAVPADDLRVDRGEIARDYDRAASDFHRLLDSAGVADLHRRSAGTRWTNQELLFHMRFGYMIVLRLLVLVRVISRLPAPVGRGFARLLNATPLFDVVNYLGSAGGGRVFDRNRLGRKFDRVVAALQRRLDREAEPNFGRGMPYPTRWDPFFTEYMTVEDIYRYPGRPFDFHRNQLTLG
ncbi:DinB family protein [Rhodococcus sp. WAY2]|uniref:DinB family protein n=1 Tax=Rhodococcus sp. WAY2 TaxID=2663121 RepID=UPI00131FD6FC|nr:DinB family protein [Rhodococcus sp. WAY2]QHE74023.1 hypothetical protein GFS60_07703 [Rhodococcus sp. WAY2]